MIVNGHVGFFILRSSCLTYMKGVLSLGQIIIESTDKNDTQVDIEEKLEKAMSALQAQRENKQFSDIYLKQRKSESDMIVKKIFSNMLDEISEVLQGKRG